MITDRDLHELLNYQARHTLLSVYLNTDPADGNADAHRLRLRSMLKDLGLPDDEQAVLRYIDHEHDWSGRSVAIFSCVPENYFRAYALAVPVRSRLRTGDRPYVKPIADLLDSYGGYGVVLVDKQGARLFFFHLGELQEQEGVVGESVRHTKRGGGSQAAGRRGGVAGQTNYEQEVAERNMRDSVSFAVDFFTARKIRRILIGGTDDNVAMFRSQLPKSWQSLVVGVFPMSMLAGQSEVLERAMSLGRQAELQRDIHLAETAVTGAAKGRGGVIGLDETLSAIRGGQVQNLLIRDGFRASGDRCQGCGYLSSQPMPACPYCGGQTEKIDDVVDLAVRQVMQWGGEVEVLRSDQEIKGFDQIGALLRY